MTVAVRRLVKSSRRGGWEATRQPDYDKNAIVEYRFNSEDVQVIQFQQQVKIIRRSLS